MKEEGEMSKPRGFVDKVVMCISKGYESGMCMVVLLLSCQFHDRHTFRSKLTSCQYSPEPKVAGHLSVLARHSSFPDTGVG